MFSVLGVRHEQAIQACISVDPSNWTAITKWAQELSLMVRQRIAEVRRAAILLKQYTHKVERAGRMELARAWSSASTESGQGSTSSQSLNKGHYLKCLKPPLFRGKVEDYPEFKARWKQLVEPWCPHHINHLYHLTSGGDPTKG